MVARTLASALAMAWAGAAYAQPSVDPQNTASALAGGPEGPTGGSSADAPQDTTQAGAEAVEDIVVTAQRRSERLVDVPISVATASPEDLERAGAESIENLTKVTPGVYLQRSAYGLSPTIRGIGSTLATSSGEQNVGLYVDEIYYATPTGNVFDLASVSGVEILKGPQGTLFGRNATGGAILIRTLDPGFDWAGRFNVSFESFDQIRSSGYLNVPVTDAIAINGSVAYRSTDGYVTDVRTGRRTTDATSLTARGKLLIQPTDHLSLILTAAYAELSDPNGIDFRNLRPAAILVALSGGPISSDPRRSTFATDQTLETTTQEYSARARLELDRGTLSSFTAWQRNDLDSVSDLTGSYLPFDVSLYTYTNTFTQEVNFASRADRPFSYVAGVYYFRNTGGVPRITQNGAPLFFNLFNDWSMSGYADGTYTFGNLSVIAGVRYTYEEISADAGFGATQATGTVTRIQRDSDGQWTPRIGLRYALSDRSNVYATYTRGYKSGRFDRSSPTGPGVDAETVDAFELGVKYASRRITFNAAAYYYNYDNTQVNATVTTPGGAIVTQLFNVPKSRIYGAEADVSVRLSDNFDLRAAAAYTHARYLEFPFAPGYILDPTDPATLGGLLFSNVSLDASGNVMVRSPEFTASGMLRFHMPVGNDDEFEITVSPYYSSRVYFTFDNSLSQGPYATVDATATLTLNQRVRLSVFGRNLTDTRYLLGGGQSAFSLATATYARPRVIGASLGLSF
jgi:iron complex outermembrane receptor protein